MTTTNPSSGYFEKVASEWDNLRAGYFTEAVREAAIRKAYLHPDMTVADVGAGTGFIAAGLAPLVKHVHVLDGSAAMLDEARRNLAQFDNVEFHEADGLVAAPAGLQAWTLSSPTCICTTAPTRWRRSARWCASCALPGGWSSPTWTRIPTNGSRPRWLTCGWASSGIRSAPGSKKPELVNVIVDCTGESCQSGCESEKGEHADISIFVAAGTKRVRMRESVQDSYAARRSVQVIAAAAIQAAARRV